MAMAVRSLAAVLACGSAAAAGTAPAGPSAAPGSASSFVEDQRRLESDAARQGRSPPPEEVAKLYRRWFDALIRPCLGAARREPRELPCCIAEYARWRSCLRHADERLVHPAGAAGRLLAGEVGAALSAIEQGRAAVLGVASPCVQGRDPQRAWLLLGLLQTGELVHELFAMEGRPPPPEPWIASACLTFEVSIRSTLDGQSTDGRARMRHALEARTLVAPLEPPGVGGPVRALPGPPRECDGGALSLTSRAPLRLSSGAVPASIPPAGGRPSRLASEWSSSEPGFGGDEKVVEVRFEVEKVEVDPGGLASCTGVAATEPRWSVAYTLDQGALDSEDFLSFYWRDFHREESLALRGSVNDYLASGFERGSGDVLARKVYRRTKPAGGYLVTEDTRIEVWHAPR